MYRAKKTVSILLLVVILLTLLYTIEFHLSSSYQSDMPLLPLNEAYTMQKSSNKEFKITQSKPEIAMSQLENNMDIIVRTTCWSRFIQEYNQWFVPSFKMFWHFNNTKVHVLIDAEQKNNLKCHKDFTRNLPRADILLREPAKDPSIYRNRGRLRMIWDYFYPELITKEKYVAFMDADSMFVTIVTPESIFKDNTKPVVNARVGLVEN